MGTGIFSTWSGNVAELGPIYPLVGWEVFFVIVCFALWIGFHVWTIRAEDKHLKEHEEKHGDRDSLVDILARESLIMEKQARREAL